MAGTFMVNGSNTTIKLEYMATSAKMQTIVAASARYFYEMEVVDGALPAVAFEGMTNQQKLDLVDKYVRRYITGASRQQKINDAIVAAAAADGDLSI